MSDTPEEAARRAGAPAREGADGGRAEPGAREAVIEECAEVCDAAIRAHGTEAERLSYPGPEFSEEMRYLSLKCGDAVRACAINIRALKSAAPSVSPTTEPPTPDAWGMEFKGELLPEIVLSEGLARQRKANRDEDYGEADSRKVIPLYRHPPAPPETTQDWRDDTTLNRVYEEGSGSRFRHRTRDPESFTRHLAGLRAVAAACSRPPVPAAGAGEPERARVYTDKELWVQGAKYVLSRYERELHAANVLNESREDAQFRADMRFGRDDPASTDLAKSKRAHPRADERRREDGT